VILLQTYLRNGQEVPSSYVLSTATKKKKDFVLCLLFLFISKNIFIVVQQPGMLEEISKKSDTGVGCSPKGLKRDKP